MQTYEEMEKLSVLNGQLVEGVYGGYAFTPDGSSKSYYVEEGIRGVEHGIYKVVDGELVKQIPCPSRAVISKILEMVKELGDDASEWSISRKWYN